MSRFGLVLGALLVLSPFVGAQPAPSVQAGITAAIKAQASKQANGTAVDYTA